jgi:hypothetical protein
LSSSSSSSSSHRRKARDAHRRVGSNAQGNGNGVGNGVGDGGASMSRNFLLRRQRVVDIAQSVPAPRRLFSDETMRAYLWPSADGEDPEDPEPSASSATLFPSIDHVGREANFRFLNYDASCYLHALLSVMFLSEPTHFRDEILGTTFASRTDTDAEFPPSVCDDRARTPVRMIKDGNGEKAHTWAEATALVRKEGATDSRIWDRIRLNGNVLVSTIEAYFSNNNIPKQTVKQENERLTLWTDGVKDKHIGGTITGESVGTSGAHMLPDGQIMTQRNAPRAAPGRFRSAELSLSGKQFSVEFQRLLRVEYAKMFEPRNGDNRECSRELRRLVAKCKPDTVDADGAFQYYEASNMYELVASLFPALVTTLSRRTYNVLNNTWTPSLARESLLHASDLLSIPNQLAEHVVAHEPAATAGTRAKVQALVAQFSRESKVDALTAFDYSANKLSATRVLVFSALSTTWDLDLRVPFLHPELDGALVGARTMNATILDGRYALFGAILNKGNNHYVALIKHRGGEWFEHDDNATKNVKAVKLAGRLLREDELDSVTGAPIAAFVTKYAAESTRRLFRHIRQVTLTIKLLTRWTATGNTSLTQPVDRRDAWLAVQKFSWMRPLLLDDQSPTTTDLWITALDQLRTTLKEPLAGANQVGAFVAESRPELLFYARTD